MKQILAGTVLMAMLLCSLLVHAQQAADTNAAAVVPTLINYSGTLTALSGKPIATITGVTFLLYKDEQGGAPLWMETQNITPDKNGHYTVMLGSTTAQGLPTDMFASGEARWLGVQPEGQAEQSRTLLVAVPYAMKAVDAQTLGGLPESAFMLASPPNSNSASVASPNPAVQPLATGTTPVTTAGGTANNLAKFDAAADITNSQIFDNGTNVGIGNTAPATKLDISGAATVRGLLYLAAQGTATATAAYKSEPINFTASAFNSSTAAAENQNFRWVAEPTGNNTTSPSAGMHLTFASGTANLAETGFSIASNGQITFAAGQTFPGTGPGTITGVTAGTDLTGGGTSGTVKLNLDTTKVPLLTSANTFTAGQTINVSGTADGLDLNVSGNGIESHSSTGAGVAGSSNGSSGVIGVTTSGSAYGVYGANTASGGVAIYGASSGTGVYGYSNSGTGVYGTTAGSGGSVNAVQGASTNATAIRGDDAGNGQGVVGTSAGTGYGVYGLSQTGSGVGGQSNAAGGNIAGVSGVNSAQNGTGVFGSDTSGYGFVTDSHVSQGRSMGGWVKAMVYVNSGGIQRCFNSQLPGSAATTVPCGINYTFNGNTLKTLLDFGFQVDDRFVQATLSGDYYTLGDAYIGLTTCIDDTCPITSTQVQVWGWANGNPYQVPFWLIIF